MGLQVLQVTRSVVGPDETTIGRGIQQECRIIVEIGNRALPADNAKRKCNFVSVGSVCFSGSFLCNFR